MDPDLWRQFMEQIDIELEERANLESNTYTWRDPVGNQRELTVTKNTTREELKQLPGGMLECAEGRIVDSLLAEAGYVNIVRDGKEIAKHRDALTPEDIPAVQAWRELQSEESEAQLERLKALHFMLEANQDIDRTVSEEVDPTETVGDRLRKIYPNIKREVRRPWWRSLFGRP